MHPQCHMSTCILCCKRHSKGTKPPEEGACCLAPTSWFVCCCVGTANQQRANGLNSSRQLPATYGAAAVTASVAAAVRESLLLSTPANTMLSSALFEDFTREVAARIIQHYWRERASRQVAADNECNHQGEHKHEPADHYASEQQQHDGCAEELPQLIQDNSLPELLMRYRAGTDTARVSQHCTEAGHSLLHSMNPGRHKTHEDTMPMRDTDMSAGKIAKGKRFCPPGPSQDVARASSSSLDRLKARHSKQRRLMPLGTAAAAQHAQHGDAKRDFETRQSRAASAGVGVTAAPAAKPALPSTNVQGKADGHAAQKPDEQSVASTVCDNSDAALLQLLNPFPLKSGAACLARAAEPRFNSSCSIQQQQPASMDLACNAGPKFPDTADENASPNVSPSKAQAQQSKQQTAGAANDIPPAGRAVTSHAATAASKPAAGMLAADSGSPSVSRAVSAVTERNSNRHKAGWLSSDKLADIFAFLDDVEAQAEQEAASVLSQASSQGPAAQPFPGRQSDCLSHDTGRTAHADTKLQQQQVKQQLQMLGQGKGRAQAADLPCCSPSVASPDGSASQQKGTAAGTGTETVLRKGVEQNEAAKGGNISGQFAANTAGITSTGEHFLGQCCHVIVARYAVISACHLPLHCQWEAVVRMPVLHIDIGNLTPQNSDICQDICVTDRPVFCASITQQDRMCYVCVL